MEAMIRRVRPGDESSLAFIQTESWKAAFRSILDEATLKQRTDPDRSTAMYKRMLDEEKGNGYILFLDGRPHCLAWWDAARDPDQAGKAEIIAIHSLPENWRRGYGSLMMDRLLTDIAAAGYSSVVLWVFAGNDRARAFYEAKGFHATDRSKPLLGAVEICYEKAL